MVLPLRQTRSGIVQASDGDYRHKIACEFTRDQYHLRFQCELRDFYPNTISLYEMDELVAVAGYRGAGSAPLFLERYLDLPIETCIQNTFATPTKRHEIVELGGFAALNRKAAFRLMASVAPVLKKLGFKVLACTANKPIQNCLTRLGLNPAFISEATAKDAKSSASNWGSYYTGQPRVLAGNITAGIYKLKEFEEQRDRQLS